MAPAIHVTCCAQLIHSFIRVLRPPVIPEAHRVAIITALKGVDAVVCPCPLVVTESFMVGQGIDLVVHGFASDADAEKQGDFFAAPKAMGRFRKIRYSSLESTTGIIDRIRAGPDQAGPALPPAAAPSAAVAPPVTTTPAPPSPIRSSAAAKAPWFGAAVAAATGGAAMLPINPFPADLLDVIEPHVCKARVRREETLGAIREATGAAGYDATLAQFRDSGLAQEGQIGFNTAEQPLRAAFLRSGGLSFDADLSHLHKTPSGKDALLCSLTRQPHAAADGFQAVFDRFVRQVCAPRLASLFDCTLAGA